MDLTMQIDEILKQRSTVQYSKLNTFNYSNSTVQLEPKKVLSSITDLVPNPDFVPWYIKQYKRLGYKRFMELVAKARAGSDTPAVLFKWMLQNNELVK